MRSTGTLRPQTPPSHDDFTRLEADVEDALGTYIETAYRLADTYQVPLASVLAFARVAARRHNLAPEP